MLLRFGIRGTLDFAKPWRLAVFLGILTLGFLGGFRSVLVATTLLLAVQFVLEGHLRTRLFPVSAITLALLFAILIPFAQKLPLSVQRTLSILPITVHPAARADAQGSTEWRLQMWRTLTPEIPKYFFLGKGYTATATDYYLMAESAKRFLVNDWENSAMAGDYHNGFLSVIIPFGIWGVMAFLAFFVAGFRVLYLNFRHGDPALKNINTVLLSMFIARFIFFCTVYGAIHLDFLTFAGLVGMSVSLNGGVARELVGAQSQASKTTSSVEDAIRPRLRAPLRPYGSGR
jgi:O-antigen ligase